MSDHLARAKQAADFDAEQGLSTAHSPDERTIPGLLAGILDALIAIADQTTPVTPVADMGAGEQQEAGA